jgi:hypothetical protein
MADIVVLGRGASIGLLHACALRALLRETGPDEPEITGTPYRASDPAWAISKALDTAASRDPDALRASISVAALTATPEEALAAPGLLAKVISLGAAGPRYPAPGPRRADLLAAIGAA